MIPSSVLQAHRDQSAQADALLADVRQLFSGRPSSWYFDARKKDLESFAQKVESGRVSDPTALEDYVGAMVVVPMLRDIPAALAFVDSFFETQYRRPEFDSVTSKASSDFPFDDLRLYGHLRASAELPSRPIDSITFEIQVKTFLQHAWSIATHDLVYKFDRVSWARSRVAYQIKALLEHAELSVAAIEELETSGHLAEVGEPERQQSLLIEYSRTNWDPDVLPADLRRVAMNLDRVLRALPMSIEEFYEICNAGATHYGGTHPSGWTPYQCLVDYVSLFSPQSLKLLLEVGASEPFLIYVTAEVLNRLGLSIEVAPFARL